MKNPWVKYGPKSEKRKHFPGQWRTLAHFEGRLMAGANSSILRVVLIIPSTKKEPSKKS